MSENREPVATINVYDVKDDATATYSEDLVLTALTLMDDEITEFLDTKRCPMVSLSDLVPDNQTAGPILDSGQEVK